MTRYSHYPHQNVAVVSESCSLLVLNKKEEERSVDKIAKEKKLLSLAGNVGAEVLVWQTVIINDT